MRRLLILFVLVIFSNFVQSCVKSDLLEDHTQKVQNQETSETDWGGTTTTTTGGN